MNFLRNLVTRKRTNAVPATPANTKQHGEEQVDPPSLPVEHVSTPSAKRKRPSEEDGVGDDPAGSGCLPTSNLNTNEPSPTHGLDGQPTLKKSRLDVPLDNINHLPSDTAPTAGDDEILTADAAPSSGGKHRRSWAIDEGSPAAKRQKYWAELMNRPFLDETVALESDDVPDDRSSTLAGDDESDDESRIFYTQPDENDGEDQDDIGDQNATSDQDDATPDLSTSLGPSKDVLGDQYVDEIDLPQSNFEPARPQPSHPSGLRTLTSLYRSKNPYKTTAILSSNSADGTQTLRKAAKKYFKLSRATNQRATYASPGADSEIDPDGILLLGIYRWSMSSAVPGARRSLDTNADDGIELPAKKRIGKVKKENFLGRPGTSMAARVARRDKRAAPLLPMSQCSSSE